jgi:hypothetical protein
MTAERPVSKWGASSGGCLVAPITSPGEPGLETGGLRQIFSCVERSGYYALATTCSSGRVIDVSTRTPGPIVDDRLMPSR